MLMLLLLRSLRTYNHTVNAHRHAELDPSLRVSRPNKDAVVGIVLKVTWVIRTPVTAASGLRAPWAQMSAYSPPSTCKVQNFVTPVCKTNILGEKQLQ